MSAVFTISSVSVHLACMQINLSFNIRSVGKNKGNNEISVGDHFLHLFLDSIGVILTSVQDTEMKYVEQCPETSNFLFCEQASCHFLAAPLSSFLVFQV